MYFLVLLEERGLKFTNSGLLITHSGHRITYEEAREQNILDDITFSLDFFMDKEKDDASSREGTFKKKLKHVYSTCMRTIKIFVS